MAEKKDSGLEAILTTAKHYKAARGALEHQEYADRLSAYYSYLEGTGRNPNAAPNPTVEQLSKWTSGATGVETKNLAGKTQEALDEVSAKLSGNEDTIAGLAIRLVLSKDKEYARYSSAIQSQDVNALRRIYVDKYGKTKDGEEDPIYMGMAYDLNAEQLTQVIGSEIKEMEKKFKVKNLYRDSGNVDRKGKSIMVYDQSTAQTYLMGTIGKLKDGEKEGALFLTGMTYDQLHEAQQRAKRK